MLIQFTLIKKKKRKTWEACFFIFDANNLFFVRLIGSVDSEICFKHSYQLYNYLGLGFDFFVLVVSSYIPTFH